MQHHSVSVQSLFKAIYLGFLWSELKHMFCVDFHWFFSVFIFLWQSFTAFLSVPSDRPLALCTSVINFVECLHFCFLCVCYFYCKYLSSNMFHILASEIKIKFILQGDTRGIYWHLVLACIDYCKLGLWIIISASSSIKKNML